MSDYEQRFGGIARLYGKDALARFREAHVAVVGIGGVGTWAVESLARSGIGKLTLVDLDDICLTNVNRQIHAMDGTVGISKIRAMADRVRAISPECEVCEMDQFYSEKSADNFFESEYDGIIDAIDGATQKAHLIAEARKRNIPLVVVGGAGGRSDPTRIQVNDLARSHGDRLLQILRKKLRTEYGFPRDTRKKFNISCVFSDETPLFPQKDGSVCTSRNPDSPGGLHCDNGFGTATHLAGCIGFTAAGLILRHLQNKTG